MKEIKDLSYYPKTDYIMGYCTACGQEVYIDEPHYKIDDEYVHTDCIWDFSQKYFKDFKVY